MKSLFDRIIDRLVAYSARGRSFDLDQVEGPRSGRGQPMPVLFDTGMTNVPRGHVMGSRAGLPLPYVWHTYFNDFDHYTAADWTITEVDGDSDGADAIGIVDGDGGLLSITNNDKDNDSEFFQKVGESFLYVAGNPMVFGARFKVSDATESDFVMGLQLTDTTPLAVTDGIWFQKDDGDALLDLHCAKNQGTTGGTVSATGIATVADDTFLTVEFVYDGESAIHYGVNGVELGTIALTYAPDDEALTISFGIQNGAAAAKIMVVDYVYVANYMGRGV